MISLEISLIFLLNTPGIPITRGSTVYLNKLAFDAIIWVAVE